MNKLTPPNATALKTSLIDLKTSLTTLETTFLTRQDKFKEAIIGNGKLKMASALRHSWGAR